MLSLNERGINTAFYAVEGITPAARQQLLCRIDEIKQEIFNILADPSAKGEEESLSLWAVDTLQSFESFGHRNSQRGPTMKFTHAVLAISFSCDGNLLSDGLC